jgi:hypothetical protein
MATQEINKIVIGGCSFSHRHLDNEISYPEVISDNLGLPLIYEAAACGSNYRIWRTITNYILNGVIDEKTILIIQYTENERKEFYSRHLMEIEEKKYPRYITLREEYKKDDELLGCIIKYKSALGKMSIDKEDKLFTLLTNNFVSPEYDYELFTVNNYMFQNMLHQNKIPTLFLNTGYNNPEIYFDEFKKLDIEWIHDLKYGYSEDDLAHLSTNGHHYLGNYLTNHIKQEWINT